MQLRRVIGLGLVLAWLAPATFVGAASPEKPTARTMTAAAEVEDAAPRSAKSKAGWDWMKRNLDPRRAFRRDEAPPPPPNVVQQPARKATPKKRPARAAKAKPAAPAPAPIVSPPPPPPIEVAPAAPVIAEIPNPSRSHRALQWLAITLSLAALVAQLVRKRGWTRESAPETVVDTVATQPSQTIDAAVTKAIETAGTLPRAFPVGGRYEILEQIGRGGMGVVYKAHDKRLDRVVALKRLPDMLDADPHAVALLLREARSAARLNHRNITTVYDVDRENGSWFITMELLEGDLLSTTLHKQGALAPAAVVSIGEQVAAGLGYAHERGIVHRDVKPANLFVTRDQTLKLMDFGVAKIVEEARRNRTMVGGTPSYMSPEQSIGEGVDGRSDLYALGATLFELLTGAVPFTSGDPLYHHRSTPPSDPRERVPGIPDQLAELVLALLRKRPEERPASADEVAEQLRQIATATLPRAPL